MKPTKSAVQQCARQTEQLFDLFLNLDTENALRRKKDINEKSEGIKTLWFRFFNWHKQSVSILIYLCFY